MASMISSLRGLQELPDGPFWRTLQCAVVESAAAVQIVDTKAGKSSLNAAIADSLAGLVFGRDAELKWVKRAAGLHVVLLSDSGDALAGALEQKELRPHPKMHSVFLWGKRSDSIMFEDRIPREFVIGRGPVPVERPLRYPERTPWPKEQSRLRLSIKSYSLTITRPELAESGVAWEPAETNISRWVEFKTED